MNCSAATTLSFHAGRVGGDTGRIILTNIALGFGHKGF